MSSTSHRARPTRGTGSGEEGSTDTRHRVIAAVGWPKSAASVCRRQRRSAMPITPELSAASCSRRDAVMVSFATSATTAAQAAVPKPLFETAEYRLVIARFEIDDPVGAEPRLCQSGPK